MPHQHLVSRIRLAAISSLIPVAIATALITFAQPAKACGGFFCELIPIDQAGEQIIFRQEGNQITAMVRILYEGDADSFSWVVPVPNLPEVSLGDDNAFLDLDQATRPRFELERRGESCDVANGAGGFPLSSSAPDAVAESDNGVEVVQEFSLGGFDVQIVRSDNGDPEAMATWLTDNGYDLTDRGRELLSPYVDGGMLFVALKLRSGADTGSIQPLVMKYQSERPMIPIRLTAVAALENMGILTWIIADERAVPDNYLHVFPNYARVNWFSGSRNAYASYQQLITDAMNEVAAGSDNESGQGFATDYAGPISQEILDGMIGSTQREQDLRFELEGLNSLDGQPAEFIARAVRDVDNGTGRFLSLNDTIPLPDGQNPDLYRDANRLRETYTAEQLVAAKDALRTNIETNELQALQTSLGLIPEGAYMTRLYTTLSADEMSVDPLFAYNADMPQQPLTRKAILEESCTDEGTAWTLTLGEGTGREGEEVIRAIQPTPFAAPAAASSLDAAFLQERTYGDAEPILIAKSAGGKLEITADGTVGPVGDFDDDDDNGFLGLGLQGPLSLGFLVSLVFLRRRITAPGE